MRTKKISLFLVVFISFQIIFSLGASAAQVDGNYITSAGACVMDYATGDVLYQHNGYVNRSPASMTKVMSLYCIFEALEKKNISYDTVVPISERAHNMPVTTDLQCIPLYYDANYTVNQLLGAVCTYSAANAVIALVEFVAGSEQEFVKIMNSTAQRLGLNATYYDCCGGYTNSISPVAMASLARSIIKDYPQIIQYTSKSSIIFNGSKYNSTNKLLTTYNYAGADGLKTGTSSSAGACFCGTAVRNGERLITVTMGSSDGTSRFTDTIALMNYGFKKIGQIYSRSLCYGQTKVFLNGYKAPVLEYVDTNVSKPVIFVEDLANYGFDVNYDSNSNCIKVTLNPQKGINPLNCEGYEGIYKTRFAKVADCEEITVVINDGKKDYIFEKVYLSKDKHAVFVEELGNVFSLYWNGETSTADIVYPGNYPHGTGGSFKINYLIKQFIKYSYNR